MTLKPLLHRLRRRFEAAVRAESPPPVFVLRDYPTVRRPVRR